MLPFQGEHSILLIKYLLYKVLKGVQPMITSDEIGGEPIRQKPRERTLAAAEERGKDEYVLTTTKS